MRVRRKDSVERLLAGLARPGISVPATPLEGELAGGGVVECEMDGTSRSKVLTVLHGLSSAPTNIQLTVVRTEAGEVILVPIVVEGSVTSTQFKIRLLGGAVFSSGIKVKVFWRATV